MRGKLSFSLSFHSIYKGKHYICYQFKQVSMNHFCPIANYFYIYLYIISIRKTALILENLRKKLLHVIVVAWLQTLIHTAFYFSCSHHYIIKWEITKYFVTQWSNILDYWHLHHHHYHLNCEYLLIDYYVLYLFQFVCIQVLKFLIVYYYGVR